MAQQSVLFDFARYRALICQDNELNSITYGFLLDRGISVQWIKPNSHRDISYMGECAISYFSGHDGDGRSLHETLEVYNCSHVPPNIIISLSHLIIFKSKLVFFFTLV